MSLNQITPELLDKTLDLLIEHCELDAISEANTRAFQSILNIDGRTLANIFALFKGHGIIQRWNDRQEVYFFILTTYAHDLKLKGGFTARYQIVDIQMKLLQAELDKLKPSIPLDSFNNIASIISTVKQFFDS